MVEVCHVELKDAFDPDKAKIGQKRRFLIEELRNVYHGRTCITMDVYRLFSKGHISALLAGQFSTPVMRSVKALKSFTPL
jgi:hypothetical protein